MLLAKAKYEPNFRSAPLPTPWPGMVVLSQHKVERDGHGVRMAGKLIAWSYHNGRHWVEMDVPVPSRSSARPLHTQNQIQQFYQSQLDQQDQQG